MSGFFVTGTDTNVGKTVVATLMALKCKAHYWKPIQTGSVNETDSDWVKKYLAPTQVLPSCYSLTEPESPHLAARLEGQEICMKKILQTWELIQKKSSAPLIIEGAGGVLVPLNKTENMRDLMVELNLPVVIVARTEVGTLNHTYLTVEALRLKKLSIAGIVMVGEKHSENLRFVEELTHVPLLAWIPWLADLSPHSLTKLAQMTDFGGSLWSYPTNNSLNF